MTDFTIFTFYSSITKNVEAPKITRLSNTKYENLFNYLKTTSFSDNVR